LSRNWQFANGIVEAFFRFRDAEHGFDTGIAVAEETHKNTSLPRRSNNDFWVLS